MSLERVVERIRSGKRFLCTCHREPDADALGSALGLAAVLRAAGKEAIVYSPDAIPETLLYLPGLDAIAREIPARTRFDGTFVTDTAAPKLLPNGFPPPEVSGPVIVLDHHAAHQDFGDVVFRDGSACATGELVVRILDALGVDPIPPDAATSLYASIVADTGGFRYPSTTPETLRLGARLLERGVDPWEAAYNLFEGWREARLRLLAEVIRTLEVDLGGKLAMLRVTREMLDMLGATDEMVEGLVTYGRTLRGVEVAALLWERVPQGKPITRISLRSRGTLDVAQIAVALGGGGHRAAAGATLEEGLDTAAARVRAETRKLLGAR